jgi:cytochrome c biogenesis protein CcmG/thiol:disulfide interchange protein DsbE
VNWKALLPAAVVVVLIGLFWRGLQLDPGTIPSPFIGKKAPALDLPPLLADERRVVLADWLGRPFVVNVWGTWCRECYREHDTLLRIKAQGLIPIVGLNWRDERERAVAYLTQAGNPFAAVGFDPDGGAAIDWGVYGAPETFLVDASGTVIHKHIGPLDWATWERDFVARIAPGGSR